MTSNLQLVKTYNAEHSIAGQDIQHHSTINKVTIFLSQHFTSNSLVAQNKLMCLMMSEIWTKEGGQKDALLRRANID